MPYERIVAGRFDVMEEEVVVVDVVVAKGVAAIHDSSRELKHSMSGISVIGPKRLSFGRCLVPQNRAEDFVGPLS